MKNLNSVIYLVSLGCTVYSEVIHVLPIQIDIAGDLLRAEQNREGSKEGELIRNYIKEGKIVPSYVTVKLLENAMNEIIQNSDDKTGRFLIDGFPRQLDQAHNFDNDVCNSRFALFLNCPEQTMENRLTERSKTSGRIDDNIESIRKRFKTFVETSMPVIDYYESLNKVVEVDCTPSVDEVYAKVKPAIMNQLN